MSNFSDTQKRKPLQFQLEKPKARVFGTKAVSKFQFAFKRFRGRGYLTRDQYRTLKIRLIYRGTDAKLHLWGCELSLSRMRNYTFLTTEGCETASVYMRNITFEGWNISQEGKTLTLW
jgi:hypothetical protein